MASQQNPLEGATAPTLEGSTNHALEIIKQLTEHPYQSAASEAAPAVGQLFDKASIPAAILGNLLYKQGNITEAIKSVLGGDRRGVVDYAQDQGLFNSKPIDYQIGYHKGQFDPDMMGKLSLSMMTDPLNYIAPGEGAGLPYFAYYDKPLFHGTPRAFKVVDPAKFDKHDTLGWMLHTSPKHDINYANMYASGSMKHAGDTPNPNIIPVVPEAHNVIDLYDTKAAWDPKDLKEVLSLFSGDGQHMKDMYYNDRDTFYTLVRTKFNDPKEFNKTSFDAVRYNDSGHEAWAIPTKTPIKTPWGTPLDKELPNEPPISNLPHINSSKATPTHNPQLFQEGWNNVKGDIKIGDTFGLEDENDNIINIWIDSNSDKYQLKNHLKAGHKIIDSNNKVIIDQLNDIYPTAMGQNQNVSSIKGPTPLDPLTLKAGDIVDAVHKDDPDNYMTNIKLDDLDIKSLDKGQGWENFNFHPKDTIEPHTGKFKSVNVPKNNLQYSPKIGDSVNVTHKATGYKFKYNIKNDNDLQNLLAEHDKYVIQAPDGWTSNPNKPVTNPIMNQPTKGWTVSPKPKYEIGKNYKLTDSFGEKYYFSNATAANLDYFNNGIPKDWTVEEDFSPNQFDSFNSTPINSNQNGIEPPIQMKVGGDYTITHPDWHDTKWSAVNQDDVDYFNNEMTKEGWTISQAIHNPKSSTSHFKTGDTAKVYDKQTGDTFNWLLGDQSNVDIFHNKIASGEFELKSPNPISSFTNQYAPNLGDTVNVKDKFTGQTALESHVIDANDMAAYNANPADWHHNYDFELATPSSSNSNLIPWEDDIPTSHEHDQLLNQTTEPDPTTFGAGHYKGVTQNIPTPSIAPSFDPFNLPVIKQNLGGFHGNVNLVGSPGGSKYVTKSLHPYGGELPTIAESYATKIANLVTAGRTPIMERVPGKGIFGPYIENTTKLPLTSSGLLDINQLKPAEIEDMLTHHAADWLVGNWDNNPDQFLRAQNKDRIYGIDKGQAWKFWKQEPQHPDITFNPNYKTADRNVYEQLFNAKPNLNIGNYSLGDEGRAIGEVIQSMHGPQIMDYAENFAKDINMPTSDYDAFMNTMERKVNQAPTDLWNFWMP